MILIRSIALLLVAFTMLSCTREEADVDQIFRTADQMTMEEKVVRGKPYHGEYMSAVEPFKVIENIYSVGSSNIGIYLITTEDGHILIDTGVSEMHQQIIANVESLGFEISDINILLSTHAHFDHVQGHEAMRVATGAKVMAVGLDAEALRLGKDISPLGFEGWEPVQDVIALQHGQEVKSGEVVLTAHEIPGHTQGCTVWAMDISDTDETFNVAIFGCRGPNGIVKIKDNADFPDLIEQSLLGYQRLNQLQPDIYLSNHPQTMFAEFGEAIRRGDRPHPLLQQTPWDELIKGIEDRFEERMSE